MDVDALIIRVFFDDAIDPHVVLTAYFTCNRPQISLPPTGMTVEFTTCCCCCCSSCSKRLGELSFCRLVVVCRTRSIVIYILFIEYVPDKKATLSALLVVKMARLFQVTELARYRDNSIDSAAFLN